MRLNPSPPTRRWFQSLLQVAVSCFLFLGAPCAAAEPGFPAAHWQERKAGDFNRDPERVDAVAVALGGRGCIIKDGYVVKTWGSQSERSDWFSSAKPVLSTL